MANPIGSSGRAIARTTCPHRLRRRQHQPLHGQRNLLLARRHRLNDEGAHPTRVGAFTHVRLRGLFHGRQLDRPLPRKHLSDPARRQAHPRSQLLDRHTPPASGAPTAPPSTGTARRCGCPSRKGGRREHYRLDPPRHQRHRRAHRRLVRRPRLPLSQKSPRQPRPRPSQRTPCHRRSTGQRTRHHEDPTATPMNDDE